jgi:hypothetical protein
MSQGTLEKVKTSRVAEVCQHFNLREEARPLLKDKQTPREFLDALLAAKQYRAAIDFLAHALPAREAIWWGCLCVGHVLPDLPPPEEAARNAAVEWVVDPTEDNRRAAQAPGDAAGLGTPAGGLARAAFWSGGSLTPPNLPAVAPDPFMPAKAVAGAVLLASTKVKGGKIPDIQRVFVEIGLGVAEGKTVWPEIKKKAPANA